MSRTLGRTPSTVTGWRRCASCRSSRRRVRPRRQLRRHVPAAAARARGVAGAHGRVLQPHRVRRLARAAARRRTTYARWSPGSPSAACCRRATPCCPATSAVRGSARSSSTRSAQREGGQPGCDVHLRPGDGQRDQRLLRRPGDPADHPRAGGAGRRPHHAEPVRARLPHRHRRRTTSRRRSTRPTRRRRWGRRRCWSPRSSDPTGPRTPSRCWPSPATAPGPCARRGCR